MLFSFSVTTTIYDTLLKGALVIDPAQKINGIFDLAITKGKIKAIKGDIPINKARNTIPLVGKIVTPGLIDAHCHPVFPLTSHSVTPDEAGVNAGVLLVNDGGSAGAGNFATLRELHYKRSKTEMTFFLNIATTGLVREPEIVSVYDIDFELLKKAFYQNQDIIKGLKLRALEPISKMEMDIVQSALDVAKDLNLPLMVHIGAFRQRMENDPMDLFTRNIIKRLRKGDIISHFMTGRPGGMVLPDRRIYPELKQAQDRGVILDSSHGKMNFNFKVAEVLMENGLQPTIITTDLSSMGVAHVQSLLVTMSKFLSLGMSLDAVISAVTQNAAKAIGIDDEWGSLKPGRPANISVMEIIEGDFTFFDGAAGNKIKSNRILEPRMVFKEGKPLPCRSYYHIPIED